MYFSLRCFCLLWGLNTRNARIFHSVNLSVIYIKIWCMQLCRSPCLNFCISSTDFGPNTLFVVAFAYLHFSCCSVCIGVCCIIPLVLISLFFPLQQLLKVQTNKMICSFCRFKEEIWWRNNITWILACSIGVYNVKDFIFQLCQCMSYTSLNNSFFLLFK